MKKWKRILLISILLTIVTLLICFVPITKWSDGIQTWEAVLSIFTSVCTIISWIWLFRTKKKEDEKRIEIKRIETVVTGNQKIQTKTGSISAHSIKKSDVTINNFNGNELLKSIDPQKHVNLKEATIRYNQYMFNRYQNLEFKGMGITDKVPLNMPLLDLYTPLNARREIPEFEKAEHNRGLEALVAGRKILDEDGIPKMFSDTEPILDILKREGSLVILGDPGSGKSTLLKWLVLIMVSGKAKFIGLDERLPILLSLSSYAQELENKQDCSLDSYLSTRFQEQVSDTLPIKELYQLALKKGRALILLDGLDEVRDNALQQKIVNRVQNFHAMHCNKGNLFILTSRIVGYKDVRLSGRLLQEVTLIDFDNIQIESFIEKWTGVIERQAHVEEKLAKIAAEKERFELIDSIKRNSGVRQLASNPLLLTILCGMKRQGVSLPERRVQLYEQYVKVLLSQWNQARNIDGITPGRNIDERQVVHLLAPLALWMHKNSAGLGLVKKQDLRRELIRLFTVKGESAPEEATDLFLADVRDFTCVLIERGDGEYGFIHLTFEEYLAGVGIALAGQGKANIIAKSISKTVDDPIWRESNLLAIAYITLIQQLEKVAGDILCWLVDNKPGRSGQAVLLAGEALVDAGKDAIPMVVREKVINALIPVYQSSEVSILFRHKIGITVSKLGWIPDDLDWFVPIAAGKFVYGEGETKTILNIDYDFYIAKFPVTNIQYQRFIKANGYNNPDFWGDDGKNWLRSNKNLAPIFSIASEFCEGLQPVVNINWFEAEAYCNWINQEFKINGVITSLGKIPIPDGYGIRLPMESEWEYAARGNEGLLYPWGNEFEKYCANTSESDIGNTTVVNTYPNGTSPFGVWDMAGNIWEWQQNKYEEGRGFRVFRGGSWSFSGQDARCARRYGSTPDDHSDLRLGFRIILSRLIL